MKFGRIFLNPGSGTNAKIAIDGCEHTWQVLVLSAPPSADVENDLCYNGNANATYLLCGRCDLAEKAKDLSTTTTQPFRKTFQALSSSKVGGKRPAAGRRAETVDLFEFFCAEELICDV